MNFNIKYKFKPEHLIKNEIYHTRDGKSDTYNTISKSNFYKEAVIKGYDKESFYLKEHSTIKDIYEIFIVKGQWNDVYVHENWIEPADSQLELNF